MGAAAWTLVGRFRVSCADIPVGVIGDIRRFLVMIPEEVFRTDAQLLRVCHMVDEHAFFSDSSMKGREKP